jgi:diaminopimelate epimerase
MPLIAVTKYQGTGNDFIVLDARDGHGHDYPAIAAQLCHRRFSLGADGLLVVEPPSLPGCAAGMRIFNADGSEARSCGNGLRCIAMFLRGEGRDDTCMIQTPAGPMQASFVERAGETWVRVCLGVPRVSEKVPPHQVSYDFLALFAVELGNAHLAAFTEVDLSALDLADCARRLRDAGNADANVEVAVIARGEISMRVDERGVGETWGCGTGACAVAAAAIASARVASPVTVRSRGGSLEVDWAGTGQPVYLTGDARFVYHTQVELPAATIPAAT